MRVSVDWLRDYIDFDLGVDELADKLTMLGLEIEAIERPGAEIEGVVVGQILSIEQHPNADKLVVCKTDVGEGDPLQIICGATNMKVGDKVPTVTEGSTIVGGFKISCRKMRGVESQGMMCAQDELGLGEDHDGLLIMDAGADIGADAKPLLGLDDAILDIEITPNRGDWASMIGVARELAALLQTEYRLPEVSIDECPEHAKGLTSVTIEDPELCPRYTGRLLRNVRIGPSPQWLCKRITAAGLRPINNVVDITNFVLMETGHPLHAFDFDKLEENRIVVRRAKPGEKMATLDGEERKLDPEMLLIADATNPVGVAGVMGGQDSEVTENTTQVLLESAYFDPKSIRRTARLLGMQTDASARFQRGADPEMALYAQNRATALMQDLTGAEVLNGVIDEYPNPVPLREVELRFQRTNMLLGTEIAPDVQRAYLVNLGFEELDAGETSCSFRAPTWRHDIAREADLIEEVGRLYGFDNVPVALPQVRPVEAVFAPRENVVSRLRHRLVGNGLTEAMNMTFSSPHEVRKANLGDEYLDMVTLANPLSENHSAMRSSLIPGLLTNVSRNLNHGASEITLFEIGPVYVPTAGQELPSEPVKLAIALAGDATVAHWSQPQRPVDFYDLRGQCEDILNSLADAYTLAESEFGTFEQRECAQVRVGDKLLGHLGLVRKNVLAAFEIGQPVYLLELTLDSLLERPRKFAQFAVPPSFPPSLRDMAILVDESSRADDILTVARKAGGKLLKRVEIFDIYRGKQVATGKKSVALGLTFQSPDRTLTEKDTQKTWDKVLRRLKNELKAELR